MTNAKPNVGASIEPMSFPSTAGGHNIAIGEPKDRWTMLIVYRGKHCPRC